MKITNKKGKKKKKKKRSGAAQSTFGRAHALMSIVVNASKCKQKNPRILNHIIFYFPNKHNVYRGACK